MLGLLICVIIGGGYGRGFSPPVMDSKCADTEFRCDNGECIELKFASNGVIERDDGSDESTFARESLLDSQLQPPKVARRGRATKFCVAPAQPANGKYTRDPSFCSGDDKCEVIEGEELEPGMQLTYTCDPGSTIEGNPDVFCTSKGNWSAIPVCTGVNCPALGSISRGATCFLRGNQQNCDFPVPPGTKAKITCQVGYKKDESNPLARRDKIKCNADGKWQPNPIDCVAACGATVNKQAPFVFNGTRASVAEFPWHATLYREILTRNGTNKEFICGGTVIHAKIVLTAAHCVYNEKTRSVTDPNTLYVATGNVLRDFDSPLHMANVVQKSKVRSIFRYCQYYGLRGNYVGDIALLYLNDSFEFSNILSPACMDVSGYSNQILEPGSYGKVAGFGVTKSGQTSGILQTITVPYVSYASCRVSRQGSQDEVFISDDKFCAGYANGTVAVCEGDSGGGLVFRKNDLWYVMGIVSVGLGDGTKNGEKTCEGFSYTLYTKVNVYVEWIQDVLSELSYNEYFSPCDLNCSPVNNDLTRTSCFSRGQWNVCDYPVPAGTRAKIDCRIGWVKNTSYDGIYECKSSGQWEPDPGTCHPSPVTESTLPSNKPLINNPSPDAIRPTPVVPTPGIKCNLSSHEEGICKPVRDCPSIATELKDIIYFPDAVCGFDKGVPNVCCRPLKAVSFGVPAYAYIPPTYRPATSRPQRPLPSSDGRGQVAYRKCNEYDSYHNLTATDGTQCFESFERKTPSLKAGRAELGEFRFMAAIGFRTESKDIEWLCGGTLISRNFVVGVAQCASHEAWGKPRRVRVGGVDLSRDDNGPQVQETMIGDVIRHPSYKRSSVYNDIALYKLEPPVKLSPWVLPACLYWFRGFPQNEFLSIGWGRVDWLDEEILTDLRKMSTSYVNQRDCNASFFVETDELTRRMPDGIVDDMIICANQSTEDACQVSRSGNPLVVRHKKPSCEFSLLGMFSFTKACGTSTAAAYTRIYHYVRWIESIVWPKG